MNSERRKDKSRDREGNRKGKRERPEKEMLRFMQVPKRKRERE
jgi:hypothetical protein